MAANPSNRQRRQLHWNSVSVRVRNKKKMQFGQTMFANLVFEKCTLQGRERIQRQKKTFYQQDLLENSGSTGTKLAHTVVRPKIHLERDETDQSFWKSYDQATFEFMENYGYLQGVACVSQLQDLQLHDQLKNEKYDFGVIEFFDFCAYAMLEKAGVNKYATTSVFTPQKSVLAALGVPSGLGVTPAWIDTLSEIPTYYERFLAMYNHIRGFFRITIPGIGRQIQAVQKYHDPNFDPDQKIAGSSYIFFNIDERLTFQQPISSKMVFLGSSEVTPQHQGLLISSDMQKIINTAKRGVVVIALGSMAKSSVMPPLLKDAFVETVKSFPDVNFIWKYEDDDEVGANVTNLYKRKWISQHEVLANPKVLAFITHGGLNSLCEAAQMAVSVICMPLCCDQLQNCQAFQAHGTAIMMKKTSNAKTLKEALKRLLNDKSIRRKAKNMADLVNNQPFTAKERFVRYIDHAIKHNIAEALDIPSRNHGFIRAHNLDYVLYFSIIIYAGFAVIYFLSLKLLSRAPADKRKVE